MGGIAAPKIAPWSASCTVIVGFGEAEFPFSYYREKDVMQEEGSERMTVFLCHLTASYKLIAGGGSSRGVGGWGYGSQS